MEKKIAIAVLTLLLASSFCEMNVTATFENPVIAEDCPDPTIWKDGDSFYLMSTGARKILVSRDLANWEDRGLRALDEESWTAAKAIGRNLWAPDVARVNGKWMLYLTCYNSAEDSKIVAFSSETPEGPFHIVGTVTDGSVTGIRDTIDPELVCEHGRVWLFFGSVGRIHRVELSSDGCKVISEYVHVAGLTEGENPQRDKVFEGCYLHRHNGWWYLFASAGQYWNHTYRIVVGRSRTLDGIFVDQDGLPMTEGNASTVVSSDENDRFYGPGHNGEIFRDRRGHDYILYHCHNTDNEKASVRNTLLQQIKWGRDGWPYVDGGKPVSNGSAPKFLLLRTRRRIKEEPAARPAKSLVASTTVAYLL